MSGLGETTFWGCAGAAGWVLAGYPATLAALPARPHRGGGAPSPVTIIVPAFCERETLPAKLRSLQRLDYPSELIRVIVAVDEDAELARLARRALPDAEVLFSPRRMGKAAAINRAAAMASGEAVVLTDANNELARGSLRAAVGHFADPAVWAVAGRRGERGSRYARYEDSIRRLESRSGSVAAMSGEFVLVRRERLPLFPDGVVNDDLWLLCELVAAGGRVIYEPRAASMEAPAAPRAELERRARIAAGRVMLASRTRRLPAPFALRLASHKGGRLALGPLLAGALLSSLALARGRPLYRAAVLAQLAIYVPGLTALAGAPTPGGPLGALATASRELIVGASGTMIGVARGLAGRQETQWKAVR